MAHSVEGYDDRRRRLPDGHMVAGSGHLILAAPVPAPPSSMAARSIA